MGLTERLGSLSSVLSFGMPLPNSQSVCGGIMTLSLLPALIIRLSVGVVGDFYASNRGAMSVRDDHRVSSPRLWDRAQRRGFPQAEAGTALPRRFGMLVYPLRRGGDMLDRRWGL